MTTPKTDTVLTMLGEVPAPFLPSGAGVMTALVEIPPGSPGSPPHRHSGPVFGYVTEGEMLFELEGEAPRVIRAGEAFSEPGGDVVHWQAANNVDDAWTRFVAVMVCAPGIPMLAFLTAEEIRDRQHRRR
jgi:quercetin dioxygenase-like cupin family protein